MATPTTLIGLLRAVHYGWRQEQIAESAREIAESARELHRRLARFVEPFAKVGRQLGSAVAAYNEAVGSFDTRVMPQVRRIEQAGAASERELGCAAAVEIDGAGDHGALARAGAIGCADELVAGRRPKASRSVAARWAPRADRPPAQ